MDERPVRIGFVGVGSMGQCAHLRNYAGLPGCEVVALAELRADVARKVAARYGVPAVYESHRQMLEHEQLDGIVASQPFARHGTLLPELVARGVPVFIEKPLAGSIESARKVLDAARRSGAWIMVGYHKRSDPATVYARREIDSLRTSGELGRLTYVRILMPAGDWIAEGFSGMVTGEGEAPRLEWDPPAPDMPANVFEKYTRFVNYYIHQVNLMRHMLCEGYEVAYADPSGVLLVVKSRSGVPGVIEMSPYSTTVDWQESVLVAFEKGWVSLELPAPLAVNRPGKVTVYRDQGGGRTPVATTPTLPWVHAMKAQAMTFVRAIRGEAKPPCDAEEALEDLVVAREYIRMVEGV